MEITLSPGDGRLTSKQLEQRKWLIDNYELILDIAYYMRDHREDMTSKGYKLFSLSDTESKVSFYEIAGRSE